MAFTHLHLHTEYSLLDGANRIHELPAHLKALGMDACAITDHGVMYGILDFYRTMKANGIHPIIGCEVYVAPRSHLEKDVAHDRDSHHLILLAENNEGYHNLVKLVSISHVDGFYYRPRVDVELLKQYHGGLIALSACLSGEVPRLVLSGDLDAAREKAVEYQGIFGKDNYFLEVQGNGLPEQNIVNAALIRMSRETGIPLVATNDCHYLKSEDSFAHEVLLCMQTGKTLSSPDRMKMDTDTLYVRSPEEMRQIFASVPEAIENTEIIAQRCQVELEFGQIHLPKFETPEGETAEQMLRRLTNEGLEKRLATRHTGIPREKYEKRLANELAVINSMGYTDYYLIVWDFIHYARTQGIMVGPGRGSGAASLAAYCLFITDIDPLQYGLLFERFLNPERVSMPDFDVDFCYERRGEVIDYVTQKYGKDHVCQVITFGTLAARAVIRDVGRALDLSYAETDRIAKMIPNQLKITIDKALEMNPDLKKIYTEDPTTKRVIDLARRFEGMPRHASTHAAGVIIADKPVSDVAPLARNDESIVVQFTKNDIESVGLMKFDFLGLRTLTVLQETANFVKGNYDVTIDYTAMAYDDSAIYDMISRGDTDGVFQLESGGMTQFMKELRPESFEDIIAGISLFRPGPMTHIPRYVEARHDAKKIRYETPLLEPILNMTYGVIVYQEQVMRIVRDLAGFSFGQADNVRRAMSKKQENLLKSYRALFIDGGQDDTGATIKGAVANGVPRRVAEKLFNDILAFAGYAFNKAHAAPYAAVAYYTAWCKHYYPVEFMAAMLNSYLGDLNKAERYVRSAEDMGIEVLPPDINKSTARFAPENGAIRFGLGAIKNVGREAIEALVREREKDGPFKTYGDFLRRMCNTALNHKMMESLVLSSACDGFGISRSKMMAVIEPFCRTVQDANKSVMEGQVSFFDLTKDVSLSLRSEPDYPDTPPFSTLESLAMEKEMTGLYVTGHPLHAYEKSIKALPLVRSDELRPRQTDDDADDIEQEDDKAELSNIELNPSTPAPINFIDRDRVIMAGLMASRRDLFTKNNDRMAFLTLEDQGGRLDVVVFPKTYASYRDVMDEHQVLVIAGQLDLRDDDDPKLLADVIAPMTEDMVKLPTSIRQKGYTKRHARGNRNGRRNGSNGYGKNERRRASYSSSKENENKSAKSAGSASGEMNARQRASSQKELSASDHNIHPADKTLVIRIPNEAPPAFREALEAALAFFSGKMPIRIYDEASGSLVKPRETSGIQWNRENAELLIDRFGRDNFGYL